MMLPMMTTFLRMDMAEAMNYFARKYKAKPGLTFDEVRDSLFLRANQLNFKKVGENLMWKDFHVVLEDKEPRASRSTPSATSPWDGICSRSPQSSSSSCPAASPSWRMPTRTSGS